MSHDIEVLYDIKSNDYLTLDKVGPILFILDSRIENSRFDEEFGIFGGVTIRQIFVGLIFRLDFVT